MDAKTKIEKFFNMSFENVINELHIKNKRSIKSLSDECSVSRDTFSRLSKLKGLKLRSIKESNKLTKNKGKNHWAYGKKRPEISDRMKKNNPSKIDSAMIKSAKSRSLYMRENPFPQESDFMVLLNTYNIKYIFQYPVYRYIVDFFIHEKNLLIEIDSRDKWDKKKREQVYKKYEYLRSKGFGLIDIWRKESNSNIINILKSNNVI